MLNYHVFIDSKFLDTFKRAVSRERDVLIFLTQDSLQELIDFFNRSEEMSTQPTIVLHGLSDLHIELIERIDEECFPIIDWVYYGYEVHNYLLRNGKRNYGLTRFDELSLAFVKYVLTGRFLYFRKNIRLISLVRRVRCFYFWDYEEFLLCKKQFGGNMSFQNFAYPLNFVENRNKQNNRNRLILNNSASPFGNHIGLLKILESQLNRFEEVLIPIAYGSRDTAERLETYVATTGYSNIKFIRDWHPMDDFVQIIGSCTHAVYGSRRQHSAGNIIRAVSLGLNVYVHSQNTTYKFLLDYDIVLFTLDEFVRELSQEERINNIIKSKNLLRLMSNWTY
jgi:hypothetical protein